MAEMNSKNIVRLILKNKVNVFIILAVAVVCAIVFSSKAFIKPLYKSSAIIYPTTTYSTSKAIMNTNGLIYVDPLEIGEEAQTDQMMQILKSGIIREKIIEKYDLMNHYGIHENCQNKIYKLNKTYDNRVKIRRTEYNSVKIIVLDTDPEVSASIANDIVTLFDETMNEMQREIALKALNILEKEYNNTKNSIIALGDSLSRHPMNKMFNYEMEMQKNNLKELKTKYDDARINATEAIPHKLVVTEAYVSDKAVYPVRWVIVLATFFATLLMIVMVLSAFEYSENKNKKQDE